MYLSTVVRPDIAFAMGRLACGMTMPMCEHQERSKRVLRCLNGTTKYGIKYSWGEGETELTTYVYSSSYGAVNIKWEVNAIYAIQYSNGPEY